MRDTVTIDAMQDNRDEAIRRAAQVLRDGGLVVFPTETVYGIGANALDPAAVAGIFAAKGRPRDNPLIAHIADLDALESLTSRVPPEALRLAEIFWPGPLTMVLPRSGLVPDAVTAGLDTVAVRMPSHPIAREIIRAAGLPVAAPSANTSGRPSPTRLEHCAEDLAGKVDLMVDGGPCAVGLESTVLSLAGEIPRLLRPGAVTLEELRAELGVVKMDPAVLHHLEEGAAASSPGMKYRHYAPRARVVLVHAGAGQFAQYVRTRAGEDVFALAFDEDMEGLGVPGVSYGPAGDPAAQARGLFAALRELDRLGARQVYARAPEMGGVGMAVYNRLVRAAGFREVRL